MMKKRLLQTYEIRRDFCSSKMMPLFPLSAVSSRGSIPPSLIASQQEQSAMESDQLPNQAKTYVFSNPELEFKLLRQLGLITYGGATFGECSEVARHMGDWDLDGWAREWSRLASTVEHRAEESLEREHFVSAREAFLRAANYYQSAEYYALLNAGSNAHFGLKCRECFLKAVPLLQFHGEAVNIETRNEFYPCYFFTPEASDGKRKTVMLVPGIESCGEEQYFYHGISALRRDYNVLIFQGPGQTGLLRHQPTNFLRHDFEVPLLVAVDYLETRQDVDMRSLAIIGSGLGGYFAARLAVFDHRVKALVVNPPFVNIHRIFRQLIGLRAANVDVAIEHINELPDTILAPRLKMFILNMCRRFGLNRLQQLLHATEQYSIEDRLYRIHCPTLSICGESPYPEMETQAQEFHDGISSTNKSLHTIPSLYGDDAHDHVSNLSELNRVIFDWLDELPAINAIRTDAEAPE